MAKRRRGRRGGVGFVLLALLLALSALLLGNQVFVVRKIAVYGNEVRTPSQVAELSGIEFGDSVFKINESEVARALSVDPYLELVSVTRASYDTIALTVHERRAIAAVRVAGAIALIDDTSRVLEWRENLPDGDIVFITGVDAGTDASGSRVVFGSYGQLEAAQALLAEISAQTLASVIGEINVSNLNDIYMVSRSGVQVLVGDSESLAAKLLWAGAVLEDLSAEGVKSGVLDVSTAKNAVYTP